MKKKKDRYVYVVKAFRTIDVGLNIPVPLCGTLSEQDAHKLAMAYIYYRGGKYRCKIEKTLNDIVEDTIIGDYSRGACKIVYNYVKKNKRLRLIWDSI